MDWYIPLTVLPAIALIILSTSNFLLALITEVDYLEQREKINNWVIEHKIGQVRRLGIANMLLYSCSLFFMFSALSLAIFEQQYAFKFLMVTAVVLFTLALIILFIHSIKAITIRERHLKEQLK